jgi:hypothetical protein
MVIRRYGRGISDRTRLALALEQPFLDCAPLRFFLAVGRYIVRSEDWVG